MFLLGPATILLALQLDACVGVSRKPRWETSLRSRMNPNSALSLSPAGTGSVVAPSESNPARVLNDAAWHLTA